MQLFRNLCRIDAEEDGVGIVPRWPSKVISAIGPGKRIRKFLRYGPLSCGGTGSEAVAGVASENR